MLTVLNYSKVGAVLSILKIFDLRCVALIVLMLLSPATGQAAGKKLKVVTTFTIIADMARNVAGDAADVVSITKPGAEIHNYQPTPRDIVKAHGAGLIFWNGLGLERWFEKFLGNLSGVPGIVVSKGVKPLGVTQGPYTGKPNPHAWMSASDGLIYVENIRKGLVEHDPANAAIYNANAAKYSARIKAMADPLRQQFNDIPQKARWLTTSEGAFSYLARDYGLKELYLWPINADAQGTPKQVKKVIDQIRRHKIAVIFSESTVSAKPSQQVARETGIHYGGVLYVDSLSKPDGPVPTYLDLLGVTTKTIAQGLSK